MFISKLQLINFKRFTNVILDLSDVQPPPRLVLLIGANGSGKSSVFDAFEWMSRQSKEGNLTGHSDYYYKTNQSVDAMAWFSDGRKIYRHDDSFPAGVQSGNKPWVRNTFYGRSALRQVPRLSRLRTGLGADLHADSDRPRYYIDFDERFENDIDNIINNLLKDVFGDQIIATDELREKYLSPFNQALRRIL